MLEETFSVTDIKKAIKKVKNDLKEEIREKYDTDIDELDTVPWDIDDFVEKLFAKLVVKRYIVEHKNGKYYIIDTLNVGKNIAHFNDMFDIDAEFEANRLCDKLNKQCHDINFDEENDDNEEDGNIAVWKVKYPSKRPFDYRRYTFPYDKITF